MHFMGLHEHGRGQIRFPEETDLTPDASRRHRKSVEGGVVSDGGVSAAWMPRPSPQGWVYGVPAIRHHLAKHTETQSRRLSCCRCSGLCGRRAASPAPTLEPQQQRPPLRPP
ncbi:hypothetical protein D7Y45_20220 [Stenotrophomonas maltophilia]|nr:hypothetical protein [Stenotrophomonas maltophilia]